ncbi:MAG: metallophosphoesterase family protein [Bacteroidales bacterium]|nr:metallophosphoesterase family protein [Bacteroidales bacterium]
MKKIGIISDTHTYLTDEIYKFYKDVDEIWHAGDIGNIETANKLADFKPFRAVYGNIDGSDIRNIHPENQRFMIEGLDVWMTHIGGYPGKYDMRVKPQIFQKPPNIFISGHSHILKVLFDKKLNLLHINPGAFGISGFHQVRTAVRLVLDNTNIKDLEVLELPKYKKTK